MTHQSANLARVSGRIAPAIRDFAAQMVGREFRADDLRTHVTKATGLTAPASADRVLRDLKAKGVIHYTLVDRAGSRYRMDRA